MRVVDAESVCEPGKDRVRQVRHCADLMCRFQRLKVS